MHPYLSGSGMRNRRDMNIRPVFFADVAGKPAKLGMETEGTSH